MKKFAKTLNAETVNKDQIILKRINLSPSNIRNATSHIAENRGNWSLAAHDKSPNAYMIKNQNKFWLLPWFWWAQEKYSNPAYLWLLLLIRTRVLSKKYKYFQIELNGEFVGIIGIDKISKIDRNGEIWYFIRWEFSEEAIMSAALHAIEKEFLSKDGLYRLYAKIDYENNISKRFLAKNGLEKETPKAKKAEFKSVFNDWRDMTYFAKTYE